MTDHDHPTASNYAAIGWALYDSTDFGGAIKAFERAITDHSNDVEALRGLGRLRLASNELAVAVILLERAATLIEAGAPAAHQARLTIERDLAWAYARLGRYDLAAPLLDRLPGQTPLARLLGSFGDRAGYRLSPGFETAEVPLVTRDPVPFVEVEVGSGSYLFVIDTGIGDVILDSGLARDLGLPLFGDGEVSVAAAQGGTVGYARLPRLKLGPVEVYDLPVEIADVRRAAPQLHGFIGTNLLARFRPTFDLARGQLRLGPRTEPFHPGSGARAAGFWLFDGHVILAPGAIGQDETLLAVASGIAGAGLFMPESSVRQAGLAAALRPEEALTGVGGGGAQQLVPVTVPEVRVGPV
ncbi:MAG TPA: hypothetical protein DEP84_13800, partial [Chloroflexi bacterium]|nr:hypothetical protein [Chloroflexota bacterium]